MKENIIMDSSIYTKERLLDVIDGLPLAIAVIDRNRKVTLANKATYLFVNKKGDRLIGLVGGDAFGCSHHDDVPQGCGFGPSCLKCELRTIVQTTMEKKELQQRVETTMTFKLHGKRDLRFCAQPLILNGEDVVLLAIEDVTEAKKHAQVAMEKERLSAVVETIGAVCHEMSQPLMVIMGFSDLLLEDLSDDDNRISSIKEIKKHAERLGDISKKLMSTTRYKTKKYLNSKILDISEASGKNDK